MPAARHVGAAMTPEIRITGPEALAGFVALAEDAADWLWARGILQWKPGSIRARQAALAGKLDRGWLVTAVIPEQAGQEIVAGCVLSQAAPRQWQGRAAAAAYLERLVVARAYAGRGLSRACPAPSSQPPRMWPASRGSTRSGWIAGPAMRPTRASIGARGFRASPR